MKQVEQRRFLFTTESRVTEMFPETFFSHCVFVCLFAFYMVRTTSDKQNSRTMQGQIMVFKD